MLKPQVLTFLGTWIDVDLGFSLLEHTMAFVRVVPCDISSPATPGKWPEVLGLRPEVSSWGEKAGFKGIRRGGRTRCWVTGGEVLECDLGWQLPVAPEWPSS